MSLEYYLAFQLSKEGIGSSLVKDIYKRVKTQSRFEYPKDFEVSLRGINLIPFYSIDYPKLLQHCSDHPAILFCQGDTELLKKRSITIVGTRKMSEYGREVIHSIIKEIPKEYVIVSGLALGVDCEVHKACLTYGVDTIAVVGGGIDVGYPGENEDVYSEISKKGLLISEFPPGVNLGKRMFPVRNRIMAGLSMVTVVVESGSRGGSFITALQAIEYGRTVAAVPGSIFSSASVGCHKLLNMGSVAVSSADEILGLC
jgi:DNA processing protein